MRISCTQCRRFVDLPEPVDILGHFVCSECRRAKADATPVPQLSSQHETPAALMARRRARGSDPMDEGRPTVPGEVPPELLAMATGEPARGPGDDPFALKFTPAANAAHPLYAPRPERTDARPSGAQPAPPRPAAGVPAPPRPAAGAPPFAAPGVAPTERTPSAPPAHGGFRPAAAPPAFAAAPAFPPAPVTTPPMQPASVPPIIDVPSEPMRGGGGSRAKIAVLVVAALVAGGLILLLTRAPRNPAEPAAQPTAAPPPPTAATAVAVQPPPTAERPASTEFDRALANDQLNKLAEEASSCRKPDDPAAVARIQVIFESSGNVKEANVEKGPLYGKPIAKCLEKLFKGAKVPPFKGDPVTLTWSVILR